MSFWLSACSLLVALDCGAVALSAFFCPSGVMNGRC